MSPSRPMLEAVSPRGVVVGVDRPERVGVALGGVVKARAASSPPDGLGMPQAGGAVGSSGGGPSAAGLRPSC
eukprot:11234417-Alexandrium_andersonii.AAC.1